MTEPPLPRRTRDWPVYLLAAACGIGTAWADIVINDLLLTALLVLAACMLLGTMRPRRPWRWVIAVVMFLPLSEGTAYRLRALILTQAQIYGAFLTALPGFAGAYGGAVMRQAIDELWQRK